MLEARHVPHLPPQRSHPNRCIYVHQRLWPFAVIRAPRLFKSRCVCARGVYLEPLEEEPAGVALVRGVGGPHDADDAARVCKVLLAAEAAKAEAHRRCCRRGEVGRAQEAPEHFGGGVALGGA